MLKNFPNPVLLAMATAPLAAQTPTAPEQESSKESQEKTKERPSVLDELAPMFGKGGAGDDLRAEMERLFREVETNLVAIDDELAMAGAGEIELGQVADSGIEKLLRSQKEKSNQVLADIDRILEITEQLGGT